MNVCDRRGRATAADLRVAGPWRPSAKGDADAMLGPPGHVAGSIHVLGLDGQIEIVRDADAVGHLDAGSDIAPASAARSEIALGAAVVNRTGERRVKLDEKSRSFRDDLERIVRSLNL